MLRVLLNVFHRPAIRSGLARESGRRFRDPRFVSFLAEANRSSTGIDLHGALLRGRKLLRQLLVLLFAGGAIWVVVESARALSVF